MDRTLDGARVLLCVSGGIAAYKAAALTSTLVQQGAQVDVLMTPEAEKFVTPLTFASLTARPVYTSLWDAPERIPHIRLVREAQVALVVPATANLLAKMAHGISDDLVSAALLAARIPVIAAPAMNAAMYEHPATVANLRTLRERGIEIVEPERGFLAERESGIGRLASEERLLAALTATLSRTQSLTDTSVVITAGPTREAFDPVRFVSNPSTGAMGIALAREAQLRGADVTLIMGPTQLEPPPGVRVIYVTTADQMQAATLEHASSAKLVIASAAVSDFRPSDALERKLKKGDQDLNVRLVRTPDVLATLGERNGKAFLVGFAAETDEHEANAREKLARKHLNAIAVNDVAGGRGFGTGRSALTLLWGADGRCELGEGDKSVLAARLLDRVVELMKSGDIKCS